MIATLFQNPIGFLIYILALVVAISVHEFSHALVAERLGDPTARLQGRVTLNPLAHLDPWGSLLLLLVGFGWGKPVVFDPYNLKNPRRDSALISLAGPFSNFLIAICSSILWILLTFINIPILLAIGSVLFFYLIRVNILLGVFNLLPIHPLDGFKIVGGVLPRDKAHEWYQLERYGFLFLIILIIPFFGKYSMLDYFITPVISFLVNLLTPHVFGFSM